MRTTRVALVVLSGLSLCACGDDDKPSKTFNIGALVGLSGNNADMAYGDSVRLAIDQWNDALKKEGEDFRFSLDLQDSEADPTIAMTRALDSVQNRGSRMLVFDTSQDVVVAAKSYYDDITSNDLGVVLMDGLGSGATIIDPNGALWQQDPDNWIWRTVMSSTPCANTAIDVLATYTPVGNNHGDINHDGVVKIATYGTNDGLGQPLLSDASARARAIFGDGVIIETAFHQPGDSVDDSNIWTTAVNKLLDSKDDIDGSSVPGHVPDMFFAGLQVLYNVPTYKAYKGYMAAHPSLDIPFMGSLAMRSNVFLTEVGANAEGAQAVGFLRVALNDSGSQFTADFSAVYGAEAGTAILYDAAAVSGLAVLIAAQQTGDIDTVGNDEIKAALPQTSATNGVRVIAGVEGMRAAIRAVKSGQAVNYDGASGHIDFDQYGDVRSFLSRNVVQSGSWVNAQIFDCTESSDSCPVVQ
jgi:ABC-type branched-subunit amino acid transport system substrate-binding protein